MINSKQYYKDLGIMLKEAKLAKDEAAEATVLGRLDSAIAHETTYEDKVTARFMFRDGASA